MGINGASVSTVACHLTIIVMNFIFVIRFTGYIPRVGKLFMKPFVASALCGVGALLTYRGIDSLTAEAFFGRTQALVCLVPSVGAAVVIYVVALGLMKGLVREDIMMLPKGTKICRLLEKFKVM
jgi:stage V sporulation protein B